MMWLAVILFIFSIVIGVWCAIEEELVGVLIALVLSMLTVVIIVGGSVPETSDKGYNVWKSYTISGNDTTDVTWHVSEKK